MKEVTKLRLMYVGVSVFAAGYLVLLFSVLRGDVEGVAGLAAVLMSTGILVIIVFGVLMARVWAQIRGEL